MTSPKTLLTAWHLRAKKQWGQHFLSEPGVSRMIVAKSKISSSDVIVEIGSGLGALTIPLAQAASKVYAIERDTRMIELLKTELLDNTLSNVVLVNQDILHLDFSAFPESKIQKMTVMGNLPYNISSQIIIALIRSRHVISRAIIMLQKELAQRITASPGCKTYGRLTVLLNYCAEVHKLAEVNGKLFFPKARVDSEVLEMRFKGVPDFPVEDEAFFYKVVQAGFSKRRKTLKNALAGSALSLDASAAGHVLELAGIDPSRRAETLSVGEFVKLSDLIGRRLVREDRVILD